LECGLGPRITPVFARFGYMIKLDSNNNKLRKAYHFLLIRLLLKKERDQTPVLLRERERERRSLCVRDICERVRV
jgi:hypothetical protein